MLDAKFARMASCLIKVCTVCSRNPAKHTVRVTRPEAKNWVSAELQVLTQCTYEDQAVKLPDLNEDVLCIFRPEAPECGFVIGSFYAGEVEPSTVDPDETQHRFNDGSVFTYNRKTHEFDFTDESTHIHADRENIRMECPKSLSLKCKDFSLSAGSSVKIAAGTTIDITAGGAITVNGKTLALN